MTLYSIFNEAAEFVRAGFHKSFEKREGKPQAEQHNIVRARVCSLAFLAACWCTHGILPLALYGGKLITGQLEKPWGPK
jgi:hypothetical protein